MGLIESVVVAPDASLRFFIVLLGALGAGALTGYLDYVLIPALASFLGIMLYGLYWQRRGQRRACRSEQLPRPIIPEALGAGQTRPGLNKKLPP